MFPTLIILGLILTALAVGVLIFIGISHQTTRGVSTLWLIATAIRNDLPLPDLIDAQAAEFRGNRGQRLLELSDMLREGTPLPVAVDNYGDLIPRAGRFAIRIGGESGTLGESIESTLKYIDRSYDPERFNFYYLLFYIFMLVNAMMSVISFVMYFIIPKFKEIFLGFGMELPEVTIRLIQVSDVFADNIFLSPLFLLVLFSVFYVLFAVARTLVAAFGSSHSRYCSLWYSLTAPLQNFGERFFPSSFRRLRSNVLRFLAISARQGRPLLGTVSSLARHLPSYRLSSKMKKVESAVEQGGELWEEMDRQSFITPHQAAMLRTAETAGELGFALDEMSLKLELDAFQGRAVLWEIGRCLLVIGLAGVTAFFAIAMFYPLINLMYGLG